MSNESAFRIIPEISKAPVLKGLSAIRLRFLDTQTKRLSPSLLKKMELVGKKIKITYLSQKQETIIILSSKGSCIQDLKLLLKTLLPDYKEASIANDNYLNIFGMALFEHLAAKFATKKMVNDTINILAFAEFIILQSYEMILQLSKIDQKKEAALISKLTKKQVNLDQKCVSFLYHKERKNIFINPGTTKEAVLLDRFTIEAGQFDYNEFVSFFSSCFNQISFYWLTFGYANDLCHRLFTSNIKDARNREKNKETPPVKNRRFDK